ncbi:MAG TPA: enoyl-CoA hydratase/isomerase family protein, partial [Solirubrobacterales bacterium]|nr:enoyl-CoA hydratase/isomerase family protein [Solirubrobacterales bacterium]
MSASIRIEERGRVLLATLSNPPHGLFNDNLVVALESLVTRAESDDGVGAVVLTGDHPDRFLAHYDVAELLAGAEESPSISPRLGRASLRVAGAARKVPGGEAALGRTPAAGLIALERFHETLLRMESCGAVFFAAINGSAMGGGCELSLACDFRWMAKGDHLIGQPEILFGFPPGGGGTQRLVRMLGTSKALGLVLDGGPLSPDEALEIGLIDRIEEM